jgi:hypothetical protein
VSTSRWPAKSVASRFTNSIEFSVMPAHMSCAKYCKTTRELRQVSARRTSDYFPLVMPATAARPRGNRDRHSQQHARPPSATACTRTPLVESPPRASLATSMPTCRLRTRPDSLLQRCCVV